MRYSRLIVLAVVVVALGTWILLVERHAPTTDELKERQGKVFPAFDTEAVTRVEVRNAHGTFDLDKEGGGDDAWKLTAPVEDAASSSAVSTLLSSLDSLRTDRRLGAGDVKLADYGLEKPALGVTVTESGGTVYSLEVGKEMPLGKTRAAVTGDGEVVLVNAYLADDLEKGLADWRSRDLLHLSAADVASLSISGGGDTVQIVHDGDAWRLTEPLADLADGQRVQDLVGALNSARIAEWVDAPADVPAMGLDDPAFRLTVVRKGDAPAVTLAFGARREQSGAQQVAVQRADAHYWVGAEVAEKLDTAPSAWRSHTLVALDAWAADTLTISAGGETADLARRDGVWKAGDVEVDFAAVSNRLRELSELEVLEFVPGRPEGDPVGTVAVTTDDGTEVQAAFFPGREAGRMAATVPGRTGTLMVDAARVEEVLADPAALTAPKPTPTPTPTAAETPKPSEEP